MSLVNSVDIFYDYVAVVVNIIVDKNLFIIIKTKLREHTLASRVRVSGIRVISVMPRSEFIASNG